MILTRFTEPRQKEKSPETLVYQGFQDFLHGATNSASPNRGNVTGDKRVTARYEQLEHVSDVVVQK